MRGVMHSANEAVLCDRFAWSKHRHKMALDLVSRADVCCNRPPDVSVLICSRRFGQTTGVLRCVWVFVPSHCVGSGVRGAPRGRGGCARIRASSRNGLSARCHLGAKAVTILGHKAHPWPALCHIPDSSGLFKMVCVIVDRLSIGSPAGVRPAGGLMLRLSRSGRPYPSIVTKWP